MKLGPHLGHCLQNLYTIHDDIEISRCIYEVAGIDCTTALNGKRLFYQNYNLGGSLSSYGENIKEITGESLGKKRQEIMTNTTFNLFRSGRTRT